MSLSYTKLRRLRNALSGLHKLSNECKEELHKWDELEDKFRHIEECLGDRMTGTQATLNLSKLIQFANDNGFPVTLSYAKRTKAGQKELFLAGKSKCDGEIKRSDHQDGKAYDLYIIFDGKICQEKAKYDILHEYWELLGGKPMIQFSNGTFDMGHFAV